MLWARERPRAAVPAGPVWALAETTSSGKGGGIGVLDGLEKLEGDIAPLHVRTGWVAIRQISLALLVYLCAESGLDIRRLGVPPQTDGTRSRPAWREVVPLLVGNNIVGWLLDGPRTGLWCFQFTYRKREVPVGHLIAAIAFYHLSEDDFGVSHYVNIMRMVEHLGCWDQLSLPDLVGVRLATGQARLFEYMCSLGFEAHLAKSSAGAAPDGDGRDKNKKGCGRGAGLLKSGIVGEAAAFTGAAEEDGCSLICPLRLEHVSRQVERDAGFLRQIRVAREERRALSS